MSQEEIPKVPSSDDNIISGPSDHDPPREEITKAKQNSVSDIPHKETPKKPRSKDEIDGSQETHPPQEEIPKVPPSDDNVISGPTDPSREETTKAKQNSTSDIPHKETPRKPRSKEDVIDFWDSTTDRPSMEEIPEILRSIWEPTEEITEVQENETATQHEIDIRQQSPRSNSLNPVREIQSSPVNHSPQGNDPDNLPVQPQALQTGKTLCNYQISCKY